MASRCTVLYFWCCLVTVALMGCGVPAGTYGYPGPADSESPSGETTPAAEGGVSGDANSGATCLEIYNAVSVCYTSYYECAGACEDQACADACQATYNGCYEGELAVGSSQGQTQFAALRTCEEEVYQGCYDEGLTVYDPCAEACSDDACLQQCGAQANDVLQGCMVQACYGEYSTCGVATDTQDTGNESSGNTGTGSDPGGTSGATTCGEGYSCVQICYGTSSDETSFYACVDGCYDVMSSQATALMNSLVACSNIQCVNVPGSVENYYRCQEDFCPEQYNACVGDTGIASSGSSQGTTQAYATCLEIHEGIIAVCVPPHSECVAACTTNDCAQACAQTMEGCIDEQQVGAPDEAVTSFQAMYGCRVDNYQGCYDAANTFYTECTAACSSGDTACQNDCNTGAGTTYEQCYETTCAAEYAACGM